MRVHLVKEVTLKEYARENARFRSIVRHWLSKIKCADWRVPENILSMMRSAGKGCSSQFLIIEKSGYGVEYTIQGN